MSQMIKGIAGYGAGRAEEHNQKMIAEQQKQAKIDRELKRARDLKDVLSANRASTAARGLVVGTGSGKAMSDFNFQRYEEDNAADSRNTQFAVSGARFRARMAKRGANMSLLAGVVGTAETAAGMS